MIDLKRRGIDQEIVSQARKGTVVFGICGGFQMLGFKICDEEGIESAVNEISGLGLLDIETKMKNVKTTVQYSGILSTEQGILKGIDNCKIKGYEIHQGITQGLEKSFFLNEESLKGTVKNNIVGTYIHGIFDNNEFTTFLLNRIRENKGIDKVDEVFDYEAYKQSEYDKLAKNLNKCLDMESIYKIMGFGS